MKDLEELINSSRLLSGINNCNNSSETKEKIKSTKTVKELIKTVKTYKDVCLELNEKEFSLDDFLFLPEEYRIKHLTTIQLQQISKLFNGDWVINWVDTKQYKYFPYFQKTGYGWRFRGSTHHSDYSHDPVVCYQTEEISTYIGKQFLNIYIDYIESL